MKKFLKYFSGLLLLVLLAVYFTPWTQLLENKLKSELAASGMEKLQFSIESVGLKQISFNNIEFGELRLPALSVGYSPMELINGDLREIHAGEINLRKENLEILLSGVDVSFITGLWSIKNINITGAPTPLPSLAGNGTITYENKIIDLTGELVSADKKVRTDFALNYPTSDSKAAVLKIKEAYLPWNEGVLSTKNVSVPLNSDKPISLVLNVKQVSLNALLSSATSNRATATGAVSGTVPVVIGRDGTFTVKKGSLKADKAGTISLSPDVIPSDAPQVVLVRELLKEFHYAIFSMGVESADNKQLVMLLSLEGNNPDVYNGRTVKLNVNLTGDVIELIMQSLAILKQ